MHLTQELVRARRATPAFGPMQLQSPRSARSQAAGSSPTDGRLALVARVTAISTLLLIAAWISLLGGVSVRKDVAADGSISTDRLFNLHPLLMALSFGICMTEAVLAYRSPWQAGASRPQRKLVHLACQTAAVALAVAGVATAWGSHALKQPPVPNLYSPHSWLGAAALVLMLGQYGVGFGAYLWPGLFPLDRRAGLGPFHRFWGLAVYGTGVAAMLVGLQEKATFLQAFGQRGLRGAFIALPAACQLLLLATLLTVLYLHAEPGTRRGSQPGPAYSALAVEEGLSAGSTAGSAGS